MGVVDEPIEDGVCDSRVADQLVPVIDGKLAGDEGRGASVPVVENFQEIAPLLGRERRQTPIIQDQQLDAGQCLEQATVMSIAAREQQGIEQPWQAMVEDRAVVAAGLVTERTGKPTLADAGLPDDQQVLMTFDPLAGDELGEQRLVEPARRFEIDIFDDGRLTKVRELEPGDEALVLALYCLAVDHETEPLLEVEGGEDALPSLFFQRLG